jgi:glycosyltransferase involved in cell wall biosynthesis
MPMPADPLRVLLLANYAPDRQESMIRFAELMAAGLTQHGVEVRLSRPPAFFLRAWGSARGVGKWLGYLDKFLLYPLLLRRDVAWAGIVHICDHSNAMYTRWMGARATVVTCHDLLAVRGARGEVSDCPASPTGRLLQAWILAGLKRAGTSGAAPPAPRRDVERIVGTPPPCLMVPNGLNHPFTVIGEAACRARLRALPGVGSRPFILHVGSNEPRKNRDGVLRTVAALSGRWDGELVIVGKPLTPELLALAAALGLSERIRQLPDVSSDQLEALYGLAHALLFPSRFEGFGWPLIEAQACGCPVVCSDCGPFREVAGDGARIRAVADEQGMADDLLAVGEGAVRADLIARGLTNAQRYTAAAMIASYIACYRAAAARHALPAQPALPHQQHTGAAVGRQAD